MNYATFTLEGYKRFLQEKVEFYASMNAGYNTGKYKGTWEAWDCIKKFEDQVDGVVDFIIFGTSASDDWEIFQELKWEYRNKLSEMLK